MDKKTIIGIDPGTNLLGFGVIDVIGGKPVFVDMGVLDLRKEADAYSKLRQIYDTVTEVCKTSTAPRWRWSRRSTARTRRLS